MGLLCAELHLGLLRLEISCVYRPCAECLSYRYKFVAPEEGGSEPSLFTRCRRQTDGDIASEHEISEIAPFFTSTNNENQTEEVSRISQHFEFAESCSDLWVALTFAGNKLMVPYFMGLRHEMDVRSPAFSLSSLRS